VRAPRIGVVGLNYWGPNLVRNFDELAELAWLCDLDDERRELLSGRYPAAQAAASF
jgi:predicted dehydrogenase